MEAIPKEVIDMAEDFFSRFSDDEKKKMLKEYYSEQPFLGKISQGWFDMMKDKKVKEQSQFLYLIIYRSYKYYNINLPVIPNNIVLNTHQDFLKDVTEKQKKDVKVMEMFIDTITTINQDDLMQYLIIHLSGNHENSFKYTVEMDMQIVFTQVIVLLKVLNNEMQKQLSNEIN
jgi:hypothetical protein